VTAPAFFIAYFNAFISVANAVTRAAIAVRIFAICPALSFVCWFNDAHLPSPWKDRFIIA